MSEGHGPLDRRTVLKTAATATAGLTAVGSAAAAGSACHECWLDVKPGSCPNSINPDSNGVVSVAAGWPHLDPESVRLVPRPEDWGDCSTREIPAADAPTCETLQSIDRSSGAAPVRSHRRDVDGDGDLDWVFTFRTGDLDLDGSVESAVLVADGTGGTRGTLVWGVDSVNVVGRPGNGNRNGNGNGNRNGNGNGPGTARSDPGRGRGRGR